MPSKTKILLAATGIALAAATAALAAPKAPGDVPLIERTKLFGNPEKTGGLLSPDGKWISFIAPRDGVLNVWVAPAADPAAARPLTAEKIRPIRQTFWAPDSRQILFVNDKGGDENFRLYGVAVDGGAARDYTPFDKVRVMPIGESTTIKDRILIGLNNRDPRWHDVYSLDLATGKLTLVMRNDGYGGFLADDALTVRLASRPRPDGGDDWFRVVNGTVEATPLVSYGHDDSLTTAPLGITTDGKTIYWMDSRDRDTSAIMAQDAGGKMTLVAQDPRVDVRRALFNPGTGAIEAYQQDYLRSEYVPVGDAVKADLAFLKAQNKGEFTVTSRTEADDKWLVAFDPVSAPASTWVYDRRAKTLKQLYVSRPALVGAPLVPMIPTVIRSRDGLDLVSYLTLPKGVDANGDGTADRPVPMVLFVHGGPWGRDGYGYNSYHQWLANRGYAVLSVNFRASTGFGKKFLAAGNMEWGRKMHDDLLDAVDWAVKRGVTTKDKVAIMGGSYGGYATLAGLAFTPETFACGVDIVGPSNLNTLLGSIPAYWEAGKQQMYRRMGDPTTPEGQAILKERSPLFAADKIKRPLLIGQGANDPRVNIRESDQVVDAMRAKNIPVTYVVFPDEGHGFARPVNNIAFNAVTENFLAPCLGGRAEPIGDALKGSTAEIRHGANYVTGLTATN
ncbi:S9 family peptidase [Sphingomonas sp. NBWT7]|uniref:S9 family peptidase n=1 Tax=Sphingomonas sp. NBWT7 TaxID=2596913 RepID=UPI0016282E6F|nr:S9 family peptidase [Sphingomonas sp. NBWT7]QNE32053.1 S9 family peptidase [Sphingomonas sp. NBWT7]